MTPKQSDFLLPAEQVGNSMRFPIGKRVKTSFPLRRSLQCRSLFICWCENAICLWSDLHFCSIHACIMSLAAVYLATDDWQPHRFVYLWKHSGGHGGNKIYSHFTFILYSIVQIRTGVVTPGTGCDTVRQSTRSDVMSPDVHACNLTSITNDGLYLPRSMIKFSHANSSQIVWLRSKHLGNVKRGDVGVCVWARVCVYEVCEQVFMMSRGGSTEARLRAGNGASRQTARCQRDVPHCLHFDLSPDSRWYPVPMSHDLSFHPGAVDVRFTNVLLWEDFLLGGSSLSAPSRLSPLCLIIHCKSRICYLTGHYASQTFLCLVLQGLSAAFLLRSNSKQKQTWCNS